MSAYKLQGKMEFKDLPISIENKKGSSRHWYDPNSGESGSTKMEYPYGYIRGTLGIDEDEVDVFIGPNEDSDKVFIVTQMKKPGFKEVDEQKVMLGFDSAAEAKKAYLGAYDDPRFFGSMKEHSMEKFKEKLISHKGKLIKHLFLDDTSANIQAMDKSENCGGEHVSKSTVDILKALTSRMLSTLVKKPAPQPEIPEAVHQPRELLGPEVARATTLQRPFEPLAVPKVTIQTPMPSGSPAAPDFMASCGSCGYTHKSLSDCPRCDGLRKQHANVATPIWRR